KRFRELIAADGLQGKMTVVLFHNHQAQRVVPILSNYRLEVERTLTDPTPIDKKLLRQWFRIKRRVRANLYIFGHVSERRAGENVYFIDTDALVVHPPLDVTVRKQLTQDFINIWSKQYRFLEEIERAGFELTAQFWFIAAKYI